MSCAQFTALPDVIAASELIAMVPTSLTRIARRAGCCVHSLPLDLPAWETEMIWTRKRQASPLGRFLVDIVREASALRHAPA
jgi:DNA-binding transcriptional LysR family regulator